MGYTVKRIQPEQDEFLAQLERDAGHPVDYYRTLAIKPEALRAYVPLHKAILGAGSVDRRVKEMVALAVSYVNESRYGIALHTAEAAKLGLGNEDMRAVQTEQDHVFPIEERVALQYARELTRTCEPDDARDELYKLYNEEQVVELTLVIALANFANRVMNGLGLRAED